MMRNATDVKSTTYLALADFLIPASGPMPAFSQVCGLDAAERSLAFRPDVREDFYRALEADPTEGAEAVLEQLCAKDREAFDALTLITVTTYYMQPRVRELIGYPGQENVPYDPLATQVYLTDGSLGRVIARGRKYRPTPELEPQTR